MSTVLPVLSPRSGYWEVTHSPVSSRPAPPALSSPGAAAGGGAGNADPFGGLGPSPRVRRGVRGVRRMARGLSVEVDGGELGAETAAENAVTAPMRQQRRPSARKRRYFFDPGERRNAHPLPQHYDVILNSSTDATGDGASDHLSCRYADFLAPELATSWGAQEGGAHEGVRAGAGAEAEVDVAHLSEFFTAAEPRTRLDAYPMFIIVRDLLRRQMAGTLQLRDSQLQKLRGEVNASFEREQAASARVQSQQAELEASRASELLELPHRVAELDRELRHARLSSKLLQVRLTIARGRVEALQKGGHPAPPRASTGSRMDGEDEREKLMQMTEQGSSAAAEMELLAMLLEQGAATELLQQGLLLLPKASLSRVAQVVQATTGIMFPIDHLQNRQQMAEAESIPDLVEWSAVAQEKEVQIWDGSKGLPQWTAYPPPVQSFLMAKIRIMAQAGGKSAPVPFIHEGKNYLLNVITMKVTAEATGVQTPFRIIATRTAERTAIEAGNCPVCALRARQDKRAKTTPSNTNGEGGWRAKAIFATIEARVSAADAFKAAQEVVALSEASLKAAMAALSAAPTPAQLKAVEDMRRQLEVAKLGEAKAQVAVTKSEAAQSTVQASTETDYDQQVEQHLSEQISDAKQATTIASTISESRSTASQLIAEIEGNADMTVMNASLTKLVASSGEMQEQGNRLLRDSLRAGETSVKLEAALAAEQAAASSTAASKAASHAAELASSNSAAAMAKAEAAATTVADATVAVAAVQEVLSRAQVDLEAARASGNAGALAEAQLALQEAEAEQEALEEKAARARQVMQQTEADAKKAELKAKVAVEAAQKAEADAAAATSGSVDIVMRRSTFATLRQAHIISTVVRKFQAGRIRSKELVPKLKNIHDSLTAAEKSFETIVTAEETKVATHSNAGLENAQIAYRIDASGQIVPVQVRALCFFSHLPKLCCGAHDLLHLPARTTTNLWPVDTGCGDGHTNRS
jgi:hypothetical protein